MGKEIVLSQAIGRHLEDTDRHINRTLVKSESSGNLYTVSQTRKNKIWMCNCPGFIRHRHCKHVDAVSKALESGEKSVKRLKK